MEMAARPKRGDTEDDLLEFQSQFLSSRNNPSAAVVRVRKDGSHDELAEETHTGDKRTESTMQRDIVDLQGLPQSLQASFGDFDPPKKKSKFREKRMAKTKEKMEPAFDGNQLEDAAELLERHDRHISTVLTEIRERDIQRSGVLMPTRVVHKGFPEALHRGNIAENQKNDNNQGKISLFAQHFKASNPDAFGLPQITPPQDLLVSVKHHKSAINIDHQTSQGSSFRPSNLVSGEGLMSPTSGHQHSAATREAERIHQENVERMSAFTQEEIMQEQERLKKSLDPSLLAFLRSRHQKKLSQTQNAAQEQENMEIEEIKPVSSTDPETKIMSDLYQIKQSSQGNNSMDVEMDIAACDNNKVTSKHVHFDDNIKVIKQEETAREVNIEIKELSEMAATQKWVNMGTIEEEKLEWMKDCQTPSAVKKESGNQARFAFDGSLITRGADIPVNVGLHHHGNEPDAAGYTLEELFVLSRSNFLQQRVVALQTLARIVTQDTQGSFINLLQSSVLSTLLDAGIIFLLRWALDDTVDAAMAVAVQCLSSVLVVPRDQEYADRVCDWHHGQEFPSLQPGNDEKKEDKTDDEDENRKQETDTEIVKKDVIKGLLQMRILPRLRYILELCRPTPTTVRGIFTILTRIAKHSTEAAHEIMKCPRMIESVFSKFLPASWKKVDTPLDDVTDMYGLPSPEALRLLRAVCSSGRHITSLLISKYGLMSYILCYTSLHPRDIQLTYNDGMDLCIESIRLWTVCISYGLACDQFRENFSTLLQHIQKLQDLSVVKHNIVTETLLECTRASALFKLLEQVIHVAGTSAELHAKMIASSPDCKNEMEADCLPPPPVNWSHVMGFLPLVVFALTKWKTEVVGLREDCLNAVLDCHVLRFASMCNLLASFYSKLPSQPSFSPVDSLEDIEDLVSTILLPVINSAFMGFLMKSLSNMSVTSSSILLTRGITSIPDYGTLPCNTQPGMTAPTEPLPHGPAATFMTSFTRLCCSVINVHKGIANKFLPFVTREEMIEYVTRISTTQEVLCQSFFGRVEHHLQYFVVKLFYMVVRSVDCNDLTTPLSVYHTAALVVFSHLRSGDEYYAHDLMSTVLFNPNFYPEATNHETTCVARELSEMNIRSQGTPTAPQLLTKENRSYSQKELLCEAHKNLLAIRSTYMGSFGKVRHALAASRGRSLHQPYDIQSLLLPSSSGPFLPADWMFVPVVDLHNQTLSAEMKGRGVDEVPHAMISTVTCTLQLILMLEEWRPVSLASVTMVAKITRLMCIFLTGSDLFLDRMVHHYVRSLLLIYTRPSCLSRLDFSGNVAGLSSFYDLYTSSLSHYSAVSFGDPLFASFLVLPLAQRQHIKFRHALWDEYVGTIRAVSFPVNQVPIPLDHFLYPIEQDDILLYLYLRALSNQEARPRWCPFFYLIAIHHVNAFIYQRINSKDTVVLKRKLSLLNHVMQVQIQDVRNDLLYYYKPLPDSSSDKAFEVFTSLPPDREILLRNRQDFEGCKKLYENMSS